MTCNMAILDNNLIASASRVLQERLPPGWAIERVAASSRAPRLRISSKDGGSRELPVSVLSRPDPRAARQIPKTTVSLGTARRAARSPGHGVNAARKVDGLEGVLVDLVEHDIASLEPAVDPRVVQAKVTGPGALLVAKMFKIHERRGSARANDKDALDVLRILQGIATEDLARRFTTILGHARSAATGARAVELFADLSVETAFVATEFPAAPSSASSC